MLQASLPDDGSLPARGPEPKPESEDRETRPRKRGRGFTPVGSEHAAAKDAANTRWLELLRGRVTGPLFYLDSWRGVEGFELRSTEALLRAGFRSEQLHSANPDKGIVSALARHGVRAFLGEWLEAPWPSEGFAGVYLDLCCGSAGYMQRQLEAACSRASPGCVLGWTLVERDFEGEALLLRVLRLGDFLRSRGWEAAGGATWTATLLHRSGGSGQQIVTQFWVRPWRCRASRK